MSNLQTRVDELKSELSEVENNNRGSTEWMRCMSMSLVAGIAAPFIIALVLYFLNPKFVQKKGKKAVRDSKKVIQWTVVFTVVIWIALYLYTYCTSAGGSALCLDK